MNRGFYTIMSAQFFSSLADSALLFVAIAVLTQLHAPEWMTPLLRSFFVISYVLLSAFVGAFSDSMPKGRVMLITNMIKIAGCSLMFFNVHPLLAYTVVGLGSAAYSPAKYGILTELLPAEKLVAANGWIETTTVASIILGTGLGGQLVGTHLPPILLSFDFPFIDTGVRTPIDAALCVVIGIYGIASLFNIFIPDTGARYRRQEHTPWKLIQDFSQCNSLLWKDKIGQISLSVTTLLWGIAATLQFLVIEWAKESLHMSLEECAPLIGFVAVGMALGAVAAARLVSLKNSLKVMPLGVVTGIIVISMTAVESRWIAYPFLVMVGALSGFYLVPMNALLQHRGHVLMNAGHSIAVQNFNENLSVLTLVGVYALMLSLKIPLNGIIIFFGLMTCVLTCVIAMKHAANQRKFDSVALIGQHKKSAPSQTASQQS
jgi:LPLT family lysophospholipid transporter-like MFS transporter